MRRGWLVGIVCLLGLGAWWWAHDRTPAGVVVDSPEPAIPRFAPVDVHGEAQAGLSLTGVVRAADGTPVSGAEVSLASSAEQSLASARCQVCQEPLLGCRAHQTTQSVQAMLDQHLGELRAAERTVTDANGRFRFDRLLGTSFTVWASAPGLGEGIKERAAPGDPVELYLPAARTLGGVVVEESGRPVAASLRALSVRLAHVTQVSASADGRFRLEGLGEGPFYVQATAPGYLPAVDARAEGGKTNLRLVLQRPRALEVHLEANGKPMDGVVRLHGDHLRRELATERGARTISSLGPQPVWVSAEAGALVAGPVRTLLNKPLTVVTLSLAPAGTLAVSVSDEAGQPVPNPTLELLVAGRDDQVLASLKLETGGVGRLGPLAAGPYRVRAQASGFRTAQVPAMVKAGGEATVVVTLTKAIAINGRVVDEYGRPAPGVSVLVSPTGDTVRADAEGRFHAEVPSSGLYSLSAHHSDWGGVERKVTAPADDVELQLEPRAGAEVTVTADGARVEGASVSLYHRGGNYRSDRPSDADGVVLMRGLEPDTYVLVAEHPRYLPSAPQTITLADGALFRGQAALKAGAAVSGQVVDTDGVAVAGALVQATARGVDAATTGPDGRFSIAPLRPQAEYSLRLADRSVELVAPVQAVAGGEPVRLVVRRLGTYRGRVVSRGAPVVRFRINGQELEASDGRFDVPLSANENRVHVSVEAAGYEPITEKRPSTPDLGDFELKPTPTITGTVVDEAGAPVADAVVGCEVCEQNALTAADGHFALGKPPYQHEFRVVARKGRRSGSRVATDLAFEGLELTLKAASSVSGTVYQLDGTPAAGVEVSGSQPDRNDAQTAVTGVDGRYTLELEPGVVRLAAAIPGLAPHAEDPPALVTQLDGTAQHIDFGPAPGSATLAVRVPLMRGYALWLVRGSLTSVGNPPMELLRSPWAMLIYQPLTDHVRFTGVPGGSYTLVWASFHGVTREGPLLVPVDVPTAAEVSLLR